MTPYIIILLFLFAALLLLRRVPKHEQNYVFWVLSLLFITFSAIRYDVGRDYFNYLDVFNGIKKASEPGFALTLYVLKYLGLPYEFFVFMMSVITIVLAVKYIAKYSTSRLMSLVIFFAFGQFYFNTFNSVRQCVVVYIFLNALIYIENRSLLKYTLSILFGALFFHMTAVLLWPLYFLVHKKYSALTKCIIVPAVLFLSKFALIIIEHSPYAVYLKFEQFSSDISPTSILLLMISFCLLFFKNSDDRVRNNVCSNINLIALIFLLLLIVFSGTPLIMVVNRLSYYFTPIVIILIPNIINRLFAPNSRFLVEVMVSLMFMAICLVVLAMNGSSTNMVPYSTIFTN